MDSTSSHLEMDALAKLLEQSRLRGFSDLKPADLHPHFSVCSACWEQFEGLANFEGKLKSGKMRVSEQPRAECPASDVWDQIASGLTPPDQTLVYLDHASRCDECAPKLRSAVRELVDLDRELTDAEREQIRALASAHPEWQRALASRISGTPLPSDKPESAWRRWFSIPRLAAFGTAVVVLATVGWWAFTERGDAASANKLLARAYTDQRTLELRIPGAAYAPLRVQRGPAESFTARSAPLLKAEALIASQLALHPDDPAWLQAAARADVLENKYVAAVASLQRAVELKPHSPDLLFDLGTAYFQRGQSEDRQEDFAAAYENLSQVLVQQPENAAALFNRAIVAEHQFLYRQALDDWEHYLRIDSSSQWADEARSHAEAMRAKLKEHEKGAEALLPPEQITASTSADVERRVEDYLEAAVRTWLPQAYPEKEVFGDPHAQQALFFLADLTSQKHHDHWLSDLLSGSTSPTFPQAVAALSRSSQSNKSGDYTTSLDQAGIAERLFRASGNKAGFLRARFEEAYGEQFTRKTGECRGHAISGLEEADREPYPWLQVQLRLQKAVCSSVGRDDWGGDEHISRQAMERAQKSGYDSLYLRALYFVADDQVSRGDLSIGLKSVASGLQVYWSKPVAPFRAYNFYNLLGRAPEFAPKYPHLVTAIWREAITLANAYGNPLVQAWAHNYAAAAAISTHEPDIAEWHYKEAARLFALAPATGAIQDYLLENEIERANLEAKLGQVESGIARLTQIQDQLNPRSDRNQDKYIEEKFYATLGALELRGRSPNQAEQAFQPALESAERRLNSMNSEAEKISWSKEAAPLYLGMAEAELVQGHTQESLEYFEWYLGAGSRSGKNGRISGTPDPTWMASRLPLLSGQTVLAYAALPDGFAIWCYDDRGVQVQWFPQANQNLEEVARRFYDLTSDPHSDLTALRRDGRSLYAALIAPIEPRLEAGRTLVIEADGWPAQVPFEALVDSNGHYLIERAPIVHSLGQTAEAGLHDGKPVSADLRALIVASGAASEEEGLVPLPDAAVEADAVAHDFHSPVVLRSSEATIIAVEEGLPEAGVFHFTGHSLAGQNGAALLLESAGAEKGKPVLLTGDKLRRLDLSNLQLAVLSTCNTESAIDGSRGFTSISASLQRAGVPHVVASRWAVDSAETRHFVESFYHSALSGKSVSQAIRESSLNMMADAQTSHPYYWSAFSTYGRP